MNRLLSRLLSRLRHPDVRKIAVYGLATGLAAALTLIQTRVLWRALKPGDFGLWALIDPMLLPVASLVLFGIDHSIVKQLRVDKLPLRVVTGTLLATTLPASVFCLFVIGFTAQFVLRLAWTDALVLTIAGEALILMMQSAFRASGEVMFFAVGLLARNLLYLGLLLLVRAITLSGALSIGQVFLTRGGVVVLVGVIAVLVMRPALRIDGTRYRDALRYGAPLLLTTFLYALSDMTDRWFLAEGTGTVAVGVYAVHLKVAAILSQGIVIPFGMWFPPERFKRMHEADEGRRFFIMTATVLALICGYLSGAVWLARDIVMSLIAPGIVAAPLVLGCGLASVASLALSQALNVGLLLPGHTTKNVICTACAGVATACSAAILVRWFGIDGAALSRLLGGLVLVGATAAWSNRVFPVAYPFASLLVFFCCSALAALCIDHFVNVHHAKGMLLAILAWTAVVLVSTVFLWQRLRGTGASTAVSSACDVTPVA